MTLGIDCDLLFSTTKVTSAGGAEAAYQAAIDPGISTVVTLPVGQSFSGSRFYLYEDGSLKQTGIERLTAASADYFSSTLFYYAYPGYEVPGAVEDFTSLYEFPYDLTEHMYTNGYKTIFFKLASGDVFLYTIDPMCFTRRSDGTWVYQANPIPFIVFGSSSDPIRSWPSLSVASTDSYGYLSSIGYSTSEQLNSIYIVNNSTRAYDWSDWEEGKTPPLPDTDPYGPGGDSDTGGGDGTFDNTSVPVPIPGLPGISAVDTKFITLYNPSLGELQNLAAYMWSSFDLTAFRKLFADPMDCILGLSIVPVAVPDGGSAEVKVGNIGTGIFMNRAGAQYVTVDCGSITVEKYWGAYLDFAPYTRAEIYLPYIGAHALAMDDIMGRTIHIAYNIDILSGACAAFIESNGTVLYTFIGQCSSSIPISGNDFTNVINGILGIAGSIGATALSGGAAAPVAVKTIASSATNVLKPSVEKSGAMAGTGGMLSIQVPYLILTRPKQAIPGLQNKEQGYPAFVTRQLGSLAGYTEVESIHLQGIPCTSQELAEIEAALKEGVIL